MKHLFELTQVGSDGRTKLGPGVLVLVILLLCVLCIGISTSKTSRARVTGIGNSSYELLTTRVESVPGHQLEWTFETNTVGNREGHQVPVSTSTKAVVQGEDDWLPLLSSASTLAESKQEMSEVMLQKLIELNPTEVVFVGHRLLKGDLVKYLSALSSVGAVTIAIGRDASGKNMLEQPDCPLRGFYFSRLLLLDQAPASQMLLAVNAKTHTALAFYGGYSFDSSTANATDNSMLELTGEPARQLLQEAKRKYLKPATDTAQIEQVRHLINEAFKAQSLDQAYAAAKNK